MLLRKRRSQVIFKDISIYFKSSCCTKSGEPPPCEKAPYKQGHYVDKSISPQKVEKVHQKMEEECAKGTTLNKTTITIGEKWLGRKDYKQQHKEFVKRILSYEKKQKKHGNDIKYIYHFELQRNGQLHSHGLEYNSAPAIFWEHYQKFGQRNAHDKSCLRVKNKQGIREYLQYINKENILPPISNI